MKTKSVDALGQEIIKAYDAGRHAMVIELSEIFLQTFPKTSAIWFFYGNSLKIFHRYKEALTAFSKSIRYASHKFPANNYCGRAMVYEDKGDFKNAVKWYQKAHESNKNEATYLIFLGVLQFRMENLQEAEATLRKATKCKEGYADEAYYNLGNVMAAQKKYKQAIKFYEKAIEIDPKYIIAKRMLKEVKEILRTKLKK